MDFDPLWRGCGYSVKGRGVDRLTSDPHLNEGRDFLMASSKSTGGRPANLYFLTVDAAKHFAMQAYASAPWSS